MNERVFLHTRFFEAGAIISALVGLSVIGIDSAWKISFLMFSLSLLFMFARHRAHLDKPDAAHLGLAASWLVMLCCDDGFTGVGATWAFYIPYSMQIQAMTRTKRARLIWLATIPVGLAAVRFTPWTLRLNRVVSQGNAELQIFIDFGAALVWSFYTFRLVQKVHERAMQGMRAPLETEN